MQIPSSHSVKCIIFSSGLHCIMKFDYGIPVFLTIIWFFQYTVGVFYDSPWHFSFPCMFVEKSDNLFCVSVLSQRKNRNNSLLGFLFVTDIIIINASWLSESCWRYFEKLRAAELTTKYMTILQVTFCPR